MVWRIGVEDTDTELGWDFHFLWPFIFWIGLRGYRRDVSKVSLNKMEGSPSCF